MATEIPIKIQFVKSLSTAQPSRIVAVKADGDTVFSLWVTDKTGIPYPLKDLQNNVIITNTDGNLQITSSSTNTNINLASSILATINSALQSGGNISELVNDVGYLVQSDIINYTNEDAQDAVGTILVDTTTIDFTYNDTTPSISADVKLNSIDATHLANNINVSKFTNDSGYITLADVDGTDLTIPVATDATTLAKGIVQLAGDLGGTADNPTTPTAIHKIGDEIKHGILTLSDGLKIVGNTTSTTATKVNVQENDGAVNTQTINTGFNKNIGLGGSDIVGANTLLNQYSTTPVDWTATAFNSGQVVFYGGKQWIAKMATVAGDVPAVSSKWEEITFEALANKTVIVDAIPTGGSNNAVSSNGVFDALATKAPISSVHNPVTLGTANGLSLSTQQLSLGLASSGVTGALSGTDWNNFNNKQNALAIVSDAEMQTGTENTKFTTALRIASWFTWIKTQAQTWAAKQTFTLAPRFSSTTASQFLKVDSNKDLASVSEASDAEMQAGTDNTKPTTALRIKNWFVWRLTQSFTFGSLTGIGDRVTQVDSTGLMTALLSVEEAIVTDVDVSNAITAGTYNIGNSFKTSITPASSKTFFVGQIYYNGVYKYEAVANNISQRFSAS